MPLPATHAPDRRVDLTPHLPALRAALDQQRRFRIEQLHELSRPDTVTVATDDPHQLVERALRAGAVAALADIECALHRLEAGTYGCCERCGRTIAIERLELIPSTVLCARCQRTRSAAAPGH